jgi:hypothetical protein
MIPINMMVQLYVMFCVCGFVGAFVKDCNDRCWDREFLQAMRISPDGF